MSMMVGCKAPDLFAGVDSISGPTLGSNQMNGTQTPFGELVSPGIDACHQLAGDKSNHFAYQVAHVSWGEMDKDGDNPIFPYTGSDAHPGRSALGSVDYSEANIDVYRQLYGSGPLGSETSIFNYGGHAAESDSRDNNHVRVTKLVIDDIGHAWPSGNGEAEGIGGIWIAQHGMHYAAYILDWFDEHNLRTPGPHPMPTVVIDEPISVAGLVISFTCSATDVDGIISNIDSKLLKDGQQVDSLYGLNSCAGSYNVIEDGSYTVEVTVSDNDGYQGVDTATAEVNQQGLFIEQPLGYSNGTSYC